LSLKDKGEESEEDDDPFQ